MYIRWSDESTTRSRILNGTFKYFNAPPSICIFLSEVTPHFNGVLTLEELGSKQAHLVTSKFQTSNLPARASYSRVNTDLVCRVLRSLILSPWRVERRQSPIPAAKLRLGTALGTVPNFRGNEWETVARAAILRLILRSTANFEVCHVRPRRDLFVLPTFPSDMYFVK